MNRLLFPAAFAAGLALLGWVGAGYLAAQPLAAVFIVVIAAAYVAGAFELHRYRTATAALVRALSAPPAEDGLTAWLEGLHASLRTAVRLRIEGQRVALPGPALAPALAGLLVLLGMLGTFLGMVVTLQGTGAALQSAADLQAVRESLSAPVRGLGLAFGASIAGVGASAMLGLMVALARRERQQAAHLLDARIADTLATHSPARHEARQRDESLRLLQRQAELTPALFERLDRWMAAMERQQQSLQERLLAGQDRFHGEAGAAYTQLAHSVDASLKASLADAARAAGAALQPVAEATMAGIARETAALRDDVARAVQSQLDGTASRFAEATSQVEASWKAAVAEQRSSNETAASALRTALDGFAHGFDERTATLVDRIAGRLDHSVAGLDAATGALANRWHEALAQHQATSDATVQQLRTALGSFADTFDSRSAALVDRVAERIDGSVGQLAGGADALSTAWQQALADHRSAADATSARLRGALEGFTTTFEARSTALVDSLAARLDGGLGQLAGGAEALTTAWQTALAEHRRTGETTAAQLRAALDGFTDGFAQRSAALVQGLTAQLEGTTGQVADSWRQALEKQSASAESMSAEARQALASAAAAFEAQAGAFSRTVDRSHAEWQERFVAQDEARLAQWTARLQGLADTLRQQWQDGHARDDARWQAQGDALARSVDALAARTHAQAEATVAEVARLVQVAAEAPRAAAEVIGELRQQLSDSMARDNVLLEERSRVLGTLSTLLDAVNHASTEQRGAIDALVNASSALLERAGTRFEQTVESQGRTLTEAAAQLTGGAAEVASLGEAFGAAVDLFGQSNEKLVAQLQRIETALGQSMARSDEQLGYYVAQAREVIDLSLSAQKQVIDELQQLADQRPASAA